MKPWLINHAVGALPLWLGGSAIIAAFSPSEPPYFYVWQAVVFLAWTLIISAYLMWVAKEQGIFDEEDEGVEVDLDNPSYRISNAAEVRGEESSNSWNEGILVDVTDGWVVVRNGKEIEEGERVCVGDVLQLRRKGE